MTTYAEFLSTKMIVAPAAGFDVDLEDLHPALFGFQRDITRWAIHRGRAAIFAGTGMGKTIMQLDWARHIAGHTSGDVLILAPLAVAQQTVEQGEQFGVPVTICRSQTDVIPGINITNYERLHLFDPAHFAGVVLDESGILKNFSGVTKKRLVTSFRQTPYRLCCTATPAPNDTAELCNHADFLGVMTPADMLSTFFISKGNDQKDGRFRLKRHARGAFFRWLASWSASLTKPSDLDYEDDGFILPPLTIEPVIIPTDWTPPGQLLFTGLKGVGHRAAVRRATLDARVAATVRVVEAEPDESWLIWTGLNDEAHALTAALPGAVNVEGSDSPDDKAEMLRRFAAGDIRILVTKAAIAGLGLNLQVCARMAFCGIGDSFETYFQAIRRCWRFGQTRPVRAYIVLSEVEAAVYENVLRKEREHEAMMRELLAAVAGYERAELAGVRGRDDYTPRKRLVLPPWLTTQASPRNEHEAVPV